MRQQRTYHSMRYGLLLAIMLLGSWATMAQPEVEATITPKEILIGAPATLTLQVKHSPELTIYWPSIGPEITIDSNQKVEVLETQKIDTIRQGGYIMQSLTMQLTAWDTGFYIIPAFGFSYNSAADTALVAFGNYPVLLQVNTVPVDTTQSFRPIKAPLDAPFSIWEYKNWIIAGVLLGILLAVLIYFLLRKKKKIIEIVAPTPVKPPHVLAMERLTALESQKLWQQGDIKGYYSGLSDIMREYLETRYKFPAIESTTFEIFISLDQTQLPPAQRDQLKQMFTLSDLAKFAKVQPLPDDHFIAMQSAKEFVKATRQTETNDV